MRTEYRAKQICRHPKCSVLISEPGYCREHKPKYQNRFSELKKADGSEAFYGSHKWKQTRAAFKRLNPLCADCREEGKIVAADVVHHIKERNDIIKEGGDPHDFKYLQSICFDHHQKELNQRRWKKKRVANNLRKGPERKRVGGW